MSGDARRVRVMLAGAAVALALPFAVPLPIRDRAIASSLVMSVIALVALMPVLRAWAVSTGRQKWVWALLAVVAAAHLATLVARVVQTLAAGPGVPSADPLAIGAHYVMLALLAPCVALLAERTGVDRMRRLRRALDFTAVMVGLTAAAFHVMYVPLQRMGADLSVEGALAIAALPVVGVLFAVVALVVRRGGWPAWRGMVGVGLCAGFFSVLVGVMVERFDGHAPGTVAAAVPDMLVMIALIAFGTAAERRVTPLADEGRPTPPSAGGSWWPGTVGSILSLVGIPLLGMIALRAQSGTERFLLWTLASLAAVVVVVRGMVLSEENRRLEAERMTDPVTALYSFDRFREALAHETRRASASAQPGALCSIDGVDIPALIRVSGQAVAGASLARIAEAVRRHIGDLGYASRVESSVLVLLPGTSVDDARRVCTEVVAELARPDGTDAGIAAAAGIAVFPRDGDDPDALIALARGAAYWSHAIGADPVTVYDPLLTDVLDSREHIARLEVQTHLHTVEALAAAVDARDRNTRDHSQHVAELAAAMALEVGLAESRAALVHAAGLLHDIGKIGVPDSVLLKGGPLSADEWDSIREHPAVGARILQGAVRPEILDWVRAHHERWDGTGYPDGLRGPAIPLEARILAICDSYDAAHTDRAYRPGLGRDEAVREIVSCAGAQFDPALVAVFERLMASSGREEAEQGPSLSDLAHLLHPVLPCLIASVDDARYGPFIEANAAATELLGMTRAELLSLSPGDLFADRTVRRDLVPADVMVAALRSDGAFSFERDIPLGDGSTISAEVVSVLAERTGRSLLVFTVRPLYVDAATRRAVERRAHKLEVLAEATRTLARPADVDDVIDRALLAALELVEARQGGVGLLVDGVLWCRYRLADGEWLRDIARDPTVGVTAAVLTEHAPLIDNAFASRIGDDPLATSLGIHGIVVVPVVDREGAPIGVLEAHNSLRAFFPEDAALLEGVASALSIAVENARARSALERQREELLSNQSTLRTLAAELAATEERERRAIAADLHDRIGQALQISKLLVSRAAASRDASETAAILSQADTLLATAITDTRTLIVEISPPMLYDLGLEAALEWLAEHADTAGVPVTFSAGQDRLDLDESARALLYRMTRELLMNAVKHADATRIDIVVSRLDDSACIEVIDDGRGFDSDAPLTHFGLRNLREQVQGMGGRFEVHARPVTGTVARIVVPIGS